MSYGFIFPKQGKSINGEVKDLAWRDDQKIFLARERVTKTLSIPQGLNLNNSFYELEIPVDKWDFYVYRAYLSDGEKTMAVDTAQNISIAGRRFIIKTTCYQGEVKKAYISFKFLSIGAGDLLKNTQLVFSAYLCLQRITL